MSRFSGEKMRMKSFVLVEENTSEFLLVSLVMDWKNLEYNDDPEGSINEKL